MVQLASGVPIGTLNVRGLSARRTQCQLNRQLTCDDLDALAVQETKVERESHTNLMGKPLTSQCNVCVAHSVGKSRGCGIFLKQASGIVKEQVITCELGRLLLSDFLFPNLKWRVIFICALTVESERIFLFENVSHYLTSDRLLLLLGDLIVYAHLKIVQKNPSGKIRSVNCWLKSSKMPTLRTWRSAYRLETE